MTHFDRGFPCTGSARGDRVTDVILRDVQTQYTNGSR